jgi:hypothetical protein
MQLLSHATARTLHVSRTSRHHVHPRWLLQLHSQQWVTTFLLTNALHLQQKILLKILPNRSAATMATDPLSSLPATQSASAHWLYARRSHFWWSARRAKPRLPHTRPTEAVTLFLTTLLSHHILFGQTSVKLWSNISQTSVKHRSNTSHSVQRLAAGLEWAAAPAAAGQVCCMPAASLRPPTHCVRAIVCPLVDQVAHGQIGKHLVAAQWCARHGVCVVLTDPLHERRPVEGAT